MKSKLLIIPAILATLIFLSASVSAGSVTVSMFYDDTNDNSLVIDDGESAGLTISADSIFEDSMTVKLDLLNNNGGFIKNIWETTTTSDSHFKHLTIEQFVYSNPGDYILRGSVVGSSGDNDFYNLYLTVNDVSEPEPDPLEITSTPVIEVDENEEYEYQVVAEGGVTPYEFRLGDGPNWLSINSQTGLISGTAPTVNEDENFFVLVEVTDNSGRFDSQGYIITVKDTSVIDPLEITSTPVIEVDENENYEYLVIVSGGVGDYEFELTQSPSWLSVDSDSGLVSGTAPEVDEDTEFDVRVRVSDGENADTQSYMLTVNDVPLSNNPPVAYDQSVTTDFDTSIKITLSATDSENDPLTFSIVSNPSNGDLSGFDSENGEVTYTPDNDFFGSDSFRFRANDGKENSNIATVNINVRAPETDSLEIISSPVREVNEGKFYTYRVEAVGGFDDYSYFLERSPEWLSINSYSGTVYGIAPEVNRSRMEGIVVEVSDNEGNTARQSYVLIIRNVPEDPEDLEITSQPVTEVDENENYEYLVIVSGGVGDYEFELTQGPSWLSVDSDSGLVSGNAPEVDEDTEFDIVLQVLDEDGNSVSQSYMLMVNDVAEDNGAPGDDEEKEKKGDEKEDDSDKDDINRFGAPSPDTEFKDKIIISDGRKTLEDISKNWIIWILIFNLLVLIAILSVYLMRRINRQ